MLTLATDFRLGKRPSGALVTSRDVGVRFDWDTEETVSPSDVGKRVVYAKDTVQLEVAPGVCLLGDLRPGDSFVEVDDVEPRRVWKIDGDDGGTNIHVTSKGKTYDNGMTLYYKTLVQKIGDPS